MKTHAMAALAGLAIGLIIGLVLTWYVQAGRVEAANARTQIANEQKKGAQHDLEQCKLGAQLQNQAIEDMRARVERANADLQAAKTARTHTDEKADTVLQERTPAGQDACTVARKAFADELRQERGQ